MLAQMVATYAATLNASARRKFYPIWSAAPSLLLGLLLTGCVTTVPPAELDSADPGVKVAGVGYRSTIAPYVSLRPVSPNSWRDQNQRAAPTPKNEQ
ncbi:hypothetical protein IP86_17365 [Rhodopseudomonas sp. AAP120]|nr:conserved hypothetical protein [Rhodopseudomonas palustris TIE-1]KPF96185.1 hypothetical protein IP86_17365 [Rhodopseudomonas sp. AAP120]